METAARLSSASMILALLLASALTLVAEAEDAPAHSQVVSSPECQGGPAAACQCLLRCEVFGGNASKCDHNKDKHAVVDAVVQTSLTQPGSQCDGMGCVVACSKELGCLSKAIKDKCRSVVRKDASCHADCNSSPHIAAALQPIFLLVLVSLFMWSS
mmetsp:Transcript_103136/g.199826  ORF Transcript_103136/g.199826 Transcript_103136/m.199826 type:complete len:157 (-) Transcript_103136:184-654(-)